MPQSVRRREHLVVVKVKKLHIPKCCYFWSFAYFASFHEFHDISTDSACPTISHQLLFSWPEGISTPWRFRHYMITTEHWYIHLLKWTQKCRIVFSPVWVYLEIWNQQMFLGIPFLERHTDWERLTQKKKKLLVMSLCPIKNMSNFMFLSGFFFIQSKAKAEFPDLKIINLKFFDVDNLIMDHQTIWNKSLTSYSWSFWIIWEFY